MPSSVIRAFDYDAGRQRLEIQFVSGRRYRYHRVPERVYRAMRRARSKGSFFNRQIRGRFAFDPLPGLTDAV